MLQKIYEKICSYQNITIARHIGVDPDALGAQFALKESIEKTFKDKNVYAVGMKSGRYGYFPKMDKYDNPGGTLLIVVDTPDKKRIDISDLETYNDICKIDHHPFIEEFGPYEYIDTLASSASELVYKFITENNMVLDEEIAKHLFLGIISDTNRFLFNTNHKTLNIISSLIEKYNLNIEELYRNLYSRPLSEIRFHGYLGQNMIVTENGLGYVIISNDTLLQYGVDTSSAGNMINDFNNIDEVQVWATITEDVKNNQYKLNIRSRGPVVNTCAEKYNGGGHKFACGARVSSLEEAKRLLSDLDEICKNYVRGA